MLDFTFLQDERECLFPCVENLILHGILLKGAKEKDTTSEAERVLETIAPKLRCLRLGGVGHQ
ncbi:hypothetical protein K470DRAFT_254815 [Piedraia hortae CBS 480.64]|uniref:Uncharacterized protein n=1 Tax=Piedraia hortae CBS 480.64 TaxID=1314780 RepID=A0A6A7C8F5_9PEZI|nr:hypothetical protein K470DRAFT_254815 [Piedraia hortae CBS 480.64]